MEILQINRESGDVVKRWNSLSEIHKETGYDITGISHSLHNRRGSAHGFIWRYSDDTSEGWVKPVRKPVSEETKRKLAEAHTGFKHTEETKERLSKIHKTLNHVELAKPLARPIAQLTLDGNIVAQWDSIREVKRKLGFNSSNIIACLKGRINTAYGYRWRYME